MKRVSLVCGIAAIGLQVTGRLVMVMSAVPTVRIAGLFVAILGFSLLITSIRFLALAKARHPGWCALGLLSVVGLVIALCLPDRNNPDRTH